MSNSSLIDELINDTMDTSNTDTISVTKNTTDAEKEKHQHTIPPNSIKLKDRDNATKAPKKTAPSEGGVTKKHVAPVENQKEKVISKKEKTDVHTTQTKTETNKAADTHDQNTTISNNDTVKEHKSDIPKKNDADVHMVNDKPDGKKKTEHKTKTGYDALIVKSRKKKNCDSLSHYIREIKRERHSQLLFGEGVSQLIANIAFAECVKIYINAQDIAIHDNRRTLMQQDIFASVKILCPERMSRMFKKGEVIPKFSRNKSTLLKQVNLKKIQAKENRKLKEKEQAQTETLKM